MHEQVPNHTVWQSHGETPHPSRQGYSLGLKCAAPPVSSISACRGSGADDAVAALVPLPSPPSILKPVPTSADEPSVSKDLKH